MAGLAPAVTKEGRGARRIGITGTGPVVTAADESQSRAR